MSSRLVSISFPDASVFRSYVDAHLCQGRAIVPRESLSGEAPELLEPVRLEVECAGRTLVLNAMIVQPHLQLSGRAAVGLQVEWSSAAHERAALMTQSPARRAPAPKVTSSPPPARPRTLRLPPETAPQAAVPFRQPQPTPASSPAVPAASMLRSSPQVEPLPGRAPSGPRVAPSAHTAVTRRIRPVEDPRSSERVRPGATVHRRTHQGHPGSGARPLSPLQRVTEAMARDTLDGEPESTMGRTQPQPRYRTGPLSVPASEVGSAEAKPVRSQRRAPLETPYSVDRIARVVERAAPVAPPVDPEKAQRANAYYEAARADLSAGRIDQARTHLNLAIAYNAREPAYRQLLVALERKIASLV